MNVLIDILLLAIVALSAFRHFRSGLIQSLLGFGKFIVSVIAAVLLGRPIGGLLANGIIGDRLSDSVYEKITGYVDGRAMSDFFNNIPKGFLHLLDLFGADVDKLEAKYGTAESSSAVLRDMSDTISMPIAQTVSSIIAYVLVFAITYIVLTVVIFGLKYIKIPILSSIDKYLGLVLGLVIGVLGAALISTAVYSFSELIAAMNGDSKIMDVYNNSLVFKFIYDLRIFEFIRKLI